MLTIKSMDWGIHFHVGPGSELGTIWAVKFQGLKCLEDGLKAKEKTWTTGGHDPLALWPHRSIGWGEMKGPEGGPLKFEAPLSTSKGGSMSSPGI